jgi:myosin heavy subunit
MSSFGRIYRERLQITDKFFSFLQDAQAKRETEFKSALVIKRAWRLHRAREDAERRNRMAIKIQKRFRKYLATIAVRCLRVEKARAARIAFFNKMATEIQRCWRGYDFRRHVFDYNKQKQYLAEVATTNVRMRRELDDHFAITRENENQAKVERERRRQEENALRSHHLVSTASIPSVFQPPAFTKDAAAMPAIENFIRNINKAKIFVPSLQSQK